MHETQTYSLCQSETSCLYIKFVVLMLFYLLSLLCHLEK